MSHWIGSIEMVDESRSVCKRSKQKVNSCTQQTWGFARMFLTMAHLHTLNPIQVHQRLGQLLYVLGEAVRETLVLDELVEERLVCKRHFILH